MVTINEMIEELVVYYEAAGLVNIYESEFSHKTEDEIRKLYHVTFKENCKYIYR